MAKEIGNWSKLTKPQRANTSEPLQQSAAALIASKLDPDEELLWASYGSGTRPWSDRIFRNVGASFLPAVFAAVVLPVAAAGTPLAAPVSSLSWLLFLVPIYVGYRTYAGPQFEAYGVTDTRAVVLQRDFPLILRTYEILVLRTEEDASGIGTVRFGKIETAPGFTVTREGPLIWLFNDTTPEAGFYGIAKPREVAHLIQTRLLEPDASVDPSDETTSMDQPVPQ